MRLIVVTIKYFAKKFCPTQHQADGARSAPRVSGAILGECFRVKECVKPRSLCESLCGNFNDGVTENL